MAKTSFKRPWSSTTESAFTNASGEVMQAFVLGVDGSDSPVGVDVDGGLKVHVQNQPATQPVSGTVGVNNFPASQAVSGTVTATRPSLPTATTTGDSGTKTATFAGATQTNDNALGAYIIVVLGTVSGTTPTLACQLQWSPDNGTAWLNLGAALGNLTASSQIGVIAVYPTAPTGTLGGAVNVATAAPLPRTWRLNYTIGGASPSFAITAVRVQYLF